MSDAGGFYAQSHAFEAIDRIAQPITDERGHTLRGCFLREDDAFVFARIVAPHDARSGDGKSLMSHAYAREYVVQCVEIAGSHERKAVQALSAVACCAVIRIEVACHYRFGDLLEHRTAVGATVGGSCFLNADNHRIFGVVGGKIAGEAHQIVGRKTVFAPDLCRTGLTGHAEILRIGRFTRTAVFTDHALETGLNVAEGLVFAHLFAQNHHGKFFDYLVVASNLGDKARLHELSAVGNAIVEGQS